MPAPGRGAGWGRRAWPAAVGGGACDAQGHRGAWPAEHAEAHGARRVSVRLCVEHGQRCGRAPVPGGAREELAERGRRREGGREKKLGFSWIQ